MSGRSASEHDPAPHCPSCDYNLTGTESDRCPWCGWEIDPNVLLSDSAGRSVARRTGIACAALATGFVVLVGMTALLVRAPRLSLFDGVAVVAVTAAVAGHLLLGGLTLAHRRRHAGPSRELRNVLGFLGWLSIVGGLAGAFQGMIVEPGRRGVEGIVVSGVFETALLAILFTLPGTALLLLRLLTFAGAAGSASLADRQTVEDAADDFAAPFSIDFFGHYATGQVETVAVDTARRTTPAIEAAIERTWEAQAALARAEDRPLYDGRLARFVHAKATADMLRLDLSVTSFREFVGTNLYNTATTFREGADALANALGVSAAIVTSDGFLCFGRRSDRVAFHAGYLHAIGGMVDAADRRDDGTYDVFGGMMREAVEELAIKETEVGSVHVTGMVRDLAIRQPELLFDILVTPTRGALRSRFNESLAGGEHTGLEFVHDDPEAILPFLENATMVAPITQAAILLHGRHQWGATWFEHACYRLYGQLPPPTA